MKLTNQDIIIQQQIRLKAGKENLSTLEAAVNRIRQAFPKNGSFVMEFIQNAEDAGSKKIHIDIQDNEVIIQNDGKVFDGDSIEHEYQWSNTNNQTLPDWVILRIWMKNCKLYTLKWE